VGALSVANITVREIYAFRDLYSDTPALANKLVIMLRTLIALGIPRGYIDRNPAVDVGPVHGDVENARPWPNDAFKRVLGRLQSGSVGQHSSAPQPAKAFGFGEIRPQA
jgi:hypothetical protein